VQITHDERDGPWGHCPVFQRSMELIGRRWSGAIIRVLLGGPMRFSDIIASVPGLSDRLLSERLRELEAEEVVSRTVIPDVPVRIEYALTQKGRELEEIVQRLDTWGEKWVKGAPVGTTN
jgi:DNA-binding HxlR family transcriptional regulator